jgi:hypothetical protein
VPILDIFEIKEFRHLELWCDDRVHFSGHGHIKIANRAARLLSLEHGYEEQSLDEIVGPDRSLRAKIAWVFRDVVPYVVRRIKGVTSGDGLEPKHDKYIKLVRKSKVKKASGIFSA